MTLITKVCLSLAAVGPLVVGVLYLKEQRFLSGHLAILGTKWSEVPERHQFLLRSFEQGIGLSLVVVGIATLPLAHSPLSKSGIWAAGIATVFGLAVLLPPARAGFVAKKRWDVPIPWQASLIFAALYVAALIAEIAVLVLNV